MHVLTTLLACWRIIQRLRIALQIALVLFILDILAWLLAIARAESA